MRGSGAARRNRGVWGLRGSTALNSWEAKGSPRATGVEGTDPELHPCGEKRVPEPHASAAPGEPSGRSDAAWEQGFVSVSSSAGRSARRAAELPPELLEGKLEMPLEEMYLPVSVFGYSRVAFPGRCLKTETTQRFCEARIKRAQAEKQFVVLGVAVGLWKVHPGRARDPPSISVAEAAGLGGQTSLGVGLSDLT